MALSISKEFSGKQSFAGTDVAVVFSIPYVEYGYLSNKTFKSAIELQTITMSSTTSVLPIRRCGESRAAAFTRGARTFAGTMVFTLLGDDPFREIFGIDALNNSIVNDNSWHIDQMPPFDIIIVAQNETGGVGIQIIDSARIVNWGTTFSVDDMYTESTYTYIAEHVTPFYAGELSFNGEANGPGISSSLQRAKTPDDLVGYLEGKKFSAREQSLKNGIEEKVRLFSANSSFLSSGGLFLSPDTSVGDSLDPAIPPQLIANMANYKTNGQSLQKINNTSLFRNRTFKA